MFQKESAEIKNFDVEAYERGDFINSDNPMNGSKRGNDLLEYTYQKQAYLDNIGKVWIRLDNRLTKNTPEMWNSRCKGLMYLEDY
jgi:hypothetical protein